MSIGSTRAICQSERMKNAPLSSIRNIIAYSDKLEQEGRSIIHLELGEPDFGTPAHIIDACKKALDNQEVHYGPIAGTVELRKALSRHCTRYGLEYAPEEILVSTGVVHGVFLSMLAYLDPGDEILVPDPGYLIYFADPHIAQAKPVSYPLREENGFQLDAETLEALITPRTKAIVIINPNNPTGALYPREVLQEIVEVARKHQLMIFSDEIYDRLVFDGEEHVSIASMAPDLFCITFSGLSKSHMIAGYRIGWMVLSGNRACARDFILGLDMLSNMRLCSNVPAQSIVQTALWGHQSVQSYVVPGGRVYEQREYVYNALNSIDGITAVKPKGGFYIFPKIDTKKFNITNDEQFALDLLHEKKILLVPGKGFNWDQPDHFRVVYLPRIEVLSECMTNLDDFLHHYRQA